MSNENSTYKVKSTGNTFRITPPEAAAINLHIKLLQDEGHEVTSCKEMVLALYKDSQAYYATDFQTENKKLKAKIQELDLKLVERMDSTENSEAKTAQQAQRIQELENQVEELSENLENQSEINLNPQAEAALNDYFNAYFKLDPEADESTAVIDLINTVKTIQKDLQGFGMAISVKKKLLKF